jgi:uncharacterized membrane protein
MDKFTRPYYTRWWYRQLVAFVGGSNAMLVWVDLMIGDWAYALMNGACTGFMVYLLWTTHKETVKWWDK